MRVLAFRDPDRPLHAAGLFGRAAQPGQGADAAGVRAMVRDGDVASTKSVFEVQDPDAGNKANTGLSFRGNSRGQKHDPCTFNRRMRKTVCPVV